MRLVAAGAASAVSILLMVIATRADLNPRIPPPEPFPSLSFREEDPPRPAPSLPPPVPSASRPVPSAPEHLRIPEPPPAVAPMMPDPKPPSTPAPPLPSDSPPPREPAPTRVIEAGVVLKQTEGTFDLSDRNLRGRQKDVRINFGEKLRTTSLVRIALAEERVVLLAPRTVIEVRPDSGRLNFMLEQGELLAELSGPGPQLSVASKGCDIIPTGTVFDVKADPGRVTIIVERGRISVRSAKGRVDLRAAESLQASDDGSLGPPGPADFKAMAWARSHRPAETSVFIEDFSKPGAWSGNIERGFARAAAPQGGGAPVLHLATDRPMFEVPVRGTISLFYRADRAGRIKLQFFLPELRTTYVRTVPVLRISSWRSMTVDLDEFVPSDKSRPARMPPGSPVTDFVIMYGDEAEKGNLWVSQIKVTELRP